VERGKVAGELAGKVSKRKHTAKLSTKIARKNTKRVAHAPCVKQPKDPSATGAGGSQEK